jgi:hypothetical protein
LFKLSAKASTGRVNPEIELLLCCTRVYLTSTTRQRIKALLKENLDWSHLINTAAAHGVTPLLYTSLNTTCPEIIPTTVLNQLRDHFFSNAQRNLFLIDELLKLLKLFKEHDIAAIPFKGPVLAASTYGNIALREFNDLDILLRKNDILRAKDLLTSVGYQPSGIQWTSAQETNEFQWGCEYTLVHEDGRRAVDLHWEITPKDFPFPIDSEYLWQHVNYTSLAGVMVTTLSAEAMILILCVHGSKHLWERLAWICDVSELIRVNQQLDWEWVIEQAATRGKRSLMLGFFLANDLLGASIPDKVLAMVHTDSMVPALATRVYEKLFQGNAPPASLSELCLFHLSVMEPWRDRIQYCILFAGRPTSEDYDFVPLPNVLFFLYYLIRPLRLVAKYVVYPYLPQSLQCHLRTLYRQARGLRR